MGVDSWIQSRESFSELDPSLPPRWGLLRLEGRIIIALIEGQIALISGSLGFEGLLEGGQAY
jgi:hypothetical protein